MYWTDIPSDGDYAITPPRTLGQGANTFTSSETTLSDGGMVVVEGSGTVTLGFYNGASESANFQAFDDGVMVGLDAFVNHGEGVRLAVNVTGASGLRIGYAGRSGKER